MIFPENLPSYVLDAQFRIRSPEVVSYLGDNTAIPEGYPTDSSSYMSIDVDFRRTYVSYTLTFGSETMSALATYYNGKFESMENAVHVRTISDSTVPHGATRSIVDTFPLIDNEPPTAVPVPIPFPVPFPPSPAQEVL